MKASDTIEISSMKGRISTAPKAQFNPMLKRYQLGIINWSLGTSFFRRLYQNGFAWLMLVTNASPVWPESVRPLLSTIVPDTMMGTSSYSSSKRV